MPGEICTRGYHLMRGYYKMPEATRQAIDSDGWLHTGDIGTMDEHGYFKITGRLKDMIIRGGENIYPREIEEFLYTNPKVSDVQVVGVPDKKYGEEVCAYVVLKDKGSATARGAYRLRKGRSEPLQGAALRAVRGYLPDDRQRQDSEVQAPRDGRARSAP